MMLVVQFNNPHMYLCCIRDDYFDGGPCGQNHHVDDSSLDAIIHEIATNIAVSNCWPPWCMLIALLYGWWPFLRSRIMHTNTRTFMQRDEMRWLGLLLLLSWLLLLRGWRRLLDLQKMRAATRETERSFFGCC